MEKELHRFNIRMGKDLFEWCRLQADELGIPVSNYMIMALAEHRKQTEAVQFTRNQAFMDLARTQIATMKQA